MLMNKNKLRFNNKVKACFISWSLKKKELYIMEIFKKNQVNLENRLFYQKMMDKLLLLDKLILNKMVKFFFQDQPLLLIIKILLYIEDKFKILKNMVMDFL